MRTYDAEGAAHNKDGGEKGGRRTTQRTEDGRKKKEGSQRKGRGGPTGTEERRAPTEILTMGLVGRGALGRGV